VFLFGRQEYSVQAQTIDWPTLGFTQVITQTFYRPVVIANANDGSDRLFIAEKVGKSASFKQTGFYTNIPEYYQQGIKWWN